MLDRIGVFRRQQKFSNLNRIDLRHRTRKAREVAERLQRHAAKKPKGASPFSKALKAVLETALALGNYLNGTSNKGSAWGFKLDSLGKLGGTKTGDNSSTLLHYMAKLLEKDDIAAKLTSEMADLEGAARTVWKDETSDLSALKASLKQVETQVKLDKIEAFTKSMGAFAQGSAKQMEQLVNQHQMQMQHQADQKMRLMQNLKRLMITKMNLKKILNNGKRRLLLAPRGISERI